MTHTHATTTPPTQGTLRTTEGRALPLRHTDVVGRLDGPVADVRVVQRFDNDAHDTIEAVYSFPLPAGASVYGMEFRIRDRVVRAVVKEKAEAAARYAQARAEGRAATLLEQDGGDVFTLSVANVPPGETVEVELRYQELLAYDDGEWRFVFPMVAPERYVEVPLTEIRHAGGAQLTGGARLPVTLDRAPRRPTGERGPDVSVELDVRAGGPIEDVRCPSHRVRIEERGPGRARVRLDTTKALANRDLVLAYRVGGAGVRPSLRFAREGDGVGTLLLALTPSSDATPSEVAGVGAMKALRCANCGATMDDVSALEQIPGLGPVYPCSFCHALLAPSTERARTRAARPRDVVVLVDRSASMRGTGPQVRGAVKAILRALPPTDAFSVVAFDHEREALADARLLAVADETIGRADAFLSSRPPRGGTELERMIEHAAERPTRDGRTPVVVLITDGAVGNEGRLLRRATELLGERRLFVLGCGPAPDRRLCARLARAGGGACEVLSPGVEDPAALARFARKVREGGPILSGLSLAWEGLDVEDPLPVALPDLHGGEPAIILARYAAPGRGRLTLTGITAEGLPFRQRLDVELPARADTPGLARLWAKRRVDAWLEEAATDPRGGARAKAEAVELALAFSLVTPHTSLVAEDDEVVGDAPPRRVEEAMARAATEAREAEPLDEGTMSLGAAADAPASRSRAAAPPPRCAPPPGCPAPMAAPAPHSSAGSIAALRAPGGGAPSPGPSPSRPSSPRRGAGRGGEGLVAKMKRMADGFFAEAAEPPAVRAPVSAPPLGCDVCYPEDELAWLKQRASGQLDLVFLVDETGSMGSYIEQVKTRLLELIRELYRMPLCSSLRLGLVTYRDHPPQDGSYASRATPLTDDVASIERAVMAMVASGGGDGPESVTDGLFDVVRMDWRPSAARVVVWFGDAPPHGVEPHGDGFPNGCPCGDHWYTQAESCREMGIAVYSVGCLPALRHYVGAEDVFRTVARTTRGLYLPLTRAHLLVPLMASAAATELDRRRVDEHVAELLERYADVLSETDEAERVRWLRAVLHDAGVRAREMAYAEGASAPPPMAARGLTEADVEGALARLRLAGRAA